MKTFNYGSEIVIGNNNFYPTFLSSDELSLILDQFISKIGDVTYLKGFVRKAASKGIEFKILVSNKPIKDVSALPTNKEYSIVIFPDWSIEILDNWISMNGMPRCEKLNDEDLDTFIYKIILSKKESLGFIEVNPIFKKDDWVLIRKIHDAVLI